MSDELIERLEKATGPDVELDYAIGQYLWSLRCEPAQCFSYGTDNPGRPFTSSIDAALTLVPEGYRTLHAGESVAGKWFWGLHMDAGHPDNPTTTRDGVSFAHQTENRPNLFADGSPSAAIALCIAALKARAAQ